MGETRGEKRSAGGGASSARGGARSGQKPAPAAPFNSVTTPSGSKYAKLGNLTPPKTKGDSELLVDLTRDRAEVRDFGGRSGQDLPVHCRCGGVGVQVDVISRVTNERIWAAGEMTNKRLEVNHEKAFGVKPVIVKTQELQGLVANGKERASNRSVPCVFFSMASARRPLGVYARCCLLGRWIVHYKSPTNKHLVIHHTVYHRGMVTEGLAQLRAAAAAIGAEVKVLFDEANYEFEEECAAKLEVRMS